MSEEGKYVVLRDGHVDVRSAGKQRRATATAATSATAAGAGNTRGVANLTKDQLEKKRANDRQAQRAIRERTKNQIERLEKRIQELTSQQPYQELARCIQQKDMVEAENAEIKARLASVLSIIQPVLGTQAGDTSVASSGQPLLARRPPSASGYHISPASSISSPSTAHPGQWQQQPSPVEPPGPTKARGPAHDPIFDQQRRNLAHGLDMGPERLGLEFLLNGSQRVQRVPNMMSHDSDSMSSQRSQTSSFSNPSPNHSTDRSRSRELNGSHVPVELVAHSTPIRNGPPTCLLDSILLDFLRERQQRAAEGVATPKLVGPAYPSVSSLLNTAHSVQSHPLSKVFTDILGTFPDISTLPEKVAVLYIMFLIMRWQISPTQENYERLPDWVTPRPSQLFTSHPVWIDHLPWPKMRDKLVRDYSPQEYLFDNFFVPFTKTLSLNWPYEATDTLLSSSESDELMINPVFERHMRRLENWSLGPAFAKAFPGLVDTFRVKVDGDGK